MTPKSSLQIKQEGFSFDATTLLQGCKYATMPYNKTDLNFGNHTKLIPDLINNNFSLELGAKQFKLTNPANLCTVIYRFGIRGF